jgi:hypothetical protein
MKTKQEIIADLRKRAHRCEIIADLYKADGDHLSALQFLAESLASSEAAKMIDAQAEWAAPHLMQVLINSRAQGRALARRQPRPRPRTQSLIQFAARSAAARLRAEQITPSNSITHKDYK